MCSRLLVLVAWLAVGCAATRGAINEPVLYAVALPQEIPTDSIGPTFPSLDGECRAVAFASAGQVYLHDLGTQEFELVSVTERGGPGSRPSGLPAPSADASRVAFNSAARLLPGPTNRHDQIYVRDRVTETTARVSVSSMGDLANDANLGLNTGLSISEDGEVVAFSSYATNLVAGDGNLSVDVFVRDLGAGTTERVSTGPLGSEAHGDSAFPSLSSDGRFVVFSSSAEDLVRDDSNGARDVFLYDRDERITERISIAADGGQANGESDLPKISADGRSVVFVSDASNLVPRDTNGVRDIFLYDRALGATRRVSALAGHQADGPSDYPDISDDGARVAFVSRASNLRKGGSSHQQVILLDLLENRLWIASSSLDGRPADDDSGDWGLSLSGDGRCVAFTSFAHNLGGAKVPSLFVVEIPLPISGVVAAQQDDEAGRP